MGKEPLIVWCFHLQTCGAPGNTVHIQGQATRDTRGHYQEIVLLCQDLYDETDGFTSFSVLCGGHWRIIPVDLVSVKNRELSK